MSWGGARKGGGRVRSKCCQLTLPKCLCDELSKSACACVSQIKATRPDDPFMGGIGHLEAKK